MTDFLCRKTKGERDDKLELCGIKQKQEAEMRKKVSGLNQSVGEIMRQRGLIL
jgi:hypothetical protein